MRKKLVTPLVLATVSLSLLMVAGCAQREAVNFNNTIANSNKKLNDAGKRFGEALQPALKGGQANLGEVKAAYQGALNALAEVKKDVGSVKVPDSASAKKLMEGYQEFLKGQEEAI